MNSRLPFHNFNLKDVVFDNQTNLIKANMIFKYKSSKTIQTQSDFKTDSTRILTNLKMLLHEMDARTEVAGNKINYREVLRRIGVGFPLKEGEIRLFWSEMDKIKIEWDTKLDSILFFTFLLGIIAGCLSGFFLNTMLVGSIIIGAAAWTFLFILWSQWVILEINDLIETSCNM